MKDNEIRRRQLRNLRSESTQTLSPNTYREPQICAQIPANFKLKLFFISICSLSFVAIFVWHLSACVNSQNDELELWKLQKTEQQNHNDLLLNAKSNELTDLKRQKQKCNNKNNFWIRYIKNIYKLFMILKSDTEILRN